MPSELWTRSLNKVDRDILSRIREVLTEAEAGRTSIADLLALRTLLEQLPLPKEHQAAFLNRASNLHRYFQAGVAAWRAELRLLHRVHQ
jgi:hypothetical protein